MSKYVPQAWRFGNGPNQYYADQYATSTARLDYDLDYDDDRFEQYRAEFLADLAAHDREVKAAALREAARDIDPNHGAGYWLRHRADRIESGSQS